MNDEYKALMWCSDFCVDREEVWMVHGDINAVINYNMKTNTTQFVTKIPKTKTIQEFLFIRIMKYKHKLILVPYFSDYLVVYDLVAKKIIFQQYMRNVYRTLAVFSDACIYENQVICMPYAVGNPITVLNLDDLEEPRQIELKNSKCNGERINHCCLYDMCIYSVIPNSGYLMKYDIKTEEIVAIEIPNVKGISGIANIGDLLCLQSIQEKTLIVWNAITQKTEFKVKLEKDSGAICKLDDNRVWVDTNEKYSNIVNVKNGTLEKVDKLITKEQLLKPKYTSGPAHRTEEAFYYYNRMRSSLMQYAGNEWKEYNIRLNVLENEEYKEDIRTNKEVMRENNSFKLADFIEII